MKRIASFTDFINEGKNDSVLNIKFGSPGTYLANAKIEDIKKEGDTFITKFTFKLEIQHEGAGWNGKTINDSFTVAMSKDSTGIFTLGKDVEKFSGIPEKDVKRDVAAGKETPEDAIIYGLCNIMNGGKDIYFWTNGTRFAGEVGKAQFSPIAAAMEQLSHEAGIHLTRLILTRAYAKMNKINTENEDWITHDYGGGEYCWPAIGDPNDDTPKLIAIDEETFATVSGAIVQMVADTFFRMASSYIPNLKI